MFNKKSLSSTEHPVQFHTPKKATATRHVIAIASGKGGVGKSTVTNNLAIGLAQQGYAVGVIDADIYGPSQSKLFGLGAQQTVMTADGKITPILVQGVAVVSTSMLLAEDSPVIWRAPMATKLIRDFLSRVQWPTDIEYLLIDLPPGTGDIQITLAQQANLSAAIVVTTPQAVACQIAEKAIQLFKKVNVPLLGLIENMSGFVCEQCHHENPIFKSGGAQKLADKYQTQVLAHIPLDSAVVDCGDAGRSLLDSSSPAATAYRNLIEKLPQALQNIEQLFNEPIKIDKQLESLTLEWSDHHAKTISAYQLRLACPCALCVDEITGRPVLKPEQIAADISLDTIARVGRYGLKIAFSDGHNTGIYTFEKLKKFQDCEVPHLKTTALEMAVLDEEKVRQLLNHDLNPQIAKHGGKIEVVRVADNRVFVKLSGGCQGCSQANVTLKQGVFKLLKQHFPALMDIVDVTDHGQGSNPYY